MIQYGDQVVQVAPQRDFSVIVHYASGEIYQYDATHITKKLEELRDFNTFQNKCCVINGTLAFDIGCNLDPYSCYDVCPDTIKMKAQRVNAISMNHRVTEIINH
ncbi:MAG: DUF2442 domain-containing protein [Bacillota bacterium]